MGHIITTHQKTHTAPYISGCGDDTTTYIKFRGQVRQRLQHRSFTLRARVGVIAVAIRQELVPITCFVCVRKVCLCHRRKKTHVSNGITNHGPRNGLPRTRDDKVRVQRIDIGVLIRCAIPVRLEHCVSGNSI